MTAQQPRFDFRRRREIDREQVRAALTADVAGSLRAFCGYAASGSPDFDEMMMIGLLLQENPRGCAETILDWLAGEVTPLRLDVASALLFGLWHPNPRVAPPTREVVARLASLRPPQRTEPDSEYSYALAMSRVADARSSSTETADLARREISLAAERGTGDPVLDQSLFDLRSRLLPKSTPATREFRAYAVSGDDAVPFVVERAVSHEKIADVLDLSEAGDTLKIRYRKTEATLSNIVVVDALESALLTNLLEKKHGGRVSSVEYVDENAAFRVTAPYP